MVKQCLRLEFGILDSDPIAYGLKRRTALIQGGLWASKGLQNKPKLIVESTEILGDKALDFLNVALTGGSCGQVKKYYSFSSTFTFK